MKSPPPPTTHHPQYRYPSLDLAFSYAPSMHLPRILRNVFFFVLVYLGHPHHPRRPDVRGRVRGGQPPRQGEVGRVACPASQPALILARPHRSAPVPTAFSSLISEFHLSWRLCMCFRVYLEVCSNLPTFFFFSPFSRSAHLATLRRDV